MPFICSAGAGVVDESTTGQRRAKAYVGIKEVQVKNKLVFTSLKNEHQ